MARFKKVSGFTLMEVMVCLSIVIVVVGIAIPSFITWRHHYQFNTQVKRFKNILVLGRSAAIEDNDTVEICPSIHHRVCDGNGDWSQDILVHELHGHVLGVMVHEKEFRINYNGNLGHNDRLLFNSLGTTLSQLGSFHIQEGREHALLTINAAGRIKES